MIFGLFAGIFWALETIVLGAAMSMTPLVSTAQALFLAPFVSTFLHDTCSALWALLYNGLRGNLPSVGKALFTRSGLLVMLGALIGGPVGMTGYVLAIRHMGPSVGAVASAVFPAIGAFLAWVFLREKMPWYRWIFLALTLLGVYGVSRSPELHISNFWLGLLGAAMCAFGWGTEAVILAKSMEAVKDEYALQLRQTASALLYGLVLLPLLRGWDFTLTLFTAPTGLLLPAIALAALFATASYLCYYRAISRLGAARAMALNVTYAAWSIVFTVLGDASVLSPSAILCAGIVLTCSILSAADLSQLLRRPPVPAS